MCARLSIGGHRHRRRRRRKPSLFSHLRRHASHCASNHRPPARGPPPAWVALKLLCLLIPAAAYADPCPRSVDPSRRSVPFATLSHINQQHHNGSWTKRRPPYRPTRYEGANRQRGQRVFAFPDCSTSTRTPRLGQSLGRHQPRLFSAIRQVSGLGVIPAARRSQPHARRLARSSPMSETWGPKV